MRSRVHEICKASECGGEAHGRAIQSGDEDLGVCVEGVCDVEVLSDEALEVVALGVGVFWGCF